MDLHVLASLLEVLRASGVEAASFREDGQLKAVSFHVPEVEESRGDPEKVVVYPTTYSEQD